MKVYKGSTLVGSLLAIFVLTTTLVALLNLQASIIRANFFREYDNAANLLASEGLELVRAVYSNNINTPNPWQGLANGKYSIDSAMNLVNPILPSPSTCNATSLPIVVNSTCSLNILPSPNQGYYRDSTGTIVYRYVEIQGINAANPNNPIDVKSTVIVRNPRFNNVKVYSSDMKLFNIQ